MSGIRGIYHAPSDSIGAHDQRPPPRRHGPAPGPRHRGRRPGVPAVRGVLDRGDSQPAHPQGLPDRGHPVHRLVRGPRRRRSRALQPVHVATYIEGLQGELAAPSVKQHLAAIKRSLDYLATGGLLPFNPAAAVRGPRHSVKQGKTSVLTAAETRTLLDNIDIGTIAGLARSRADWGDGLHLRPGWRGGRDAERGLLRARPQDVGSVARKRRQGARHAMPP